MDSDVRWLDEREARTWRSLQLMHLLVDGELSRRLAAESSLSYADYVVLVSLTAQDDGSIRMNELGAQIGWEKSRVSHQITRMERRGLVTKQSCPTDRRGLFVTVTDEGRREIEAAAPGHVSAVREVFLDHLDADQLDQLSEITDSVLRSIAPPHLRDLVEPAGPN